MLTTQYLRDNSIVITPSYGVGSTYTINRPDQKDFPIDPTTCNHGDVIVGVANDAQQLVVDLEVHDLHRALGAVHYYCALQFDGCRRWNQTQNIPCNSYGYGHSDCPDELGVLHRIQVERMVDKRDIKHYVENNDWRGAREMVGQYTNGFWTITDAVKAGIDTFVQHFSREWELQSQYVKLLEDGTYDYSHEYESIILVSPNDRIA